MQTVPCVFFHDQRNRVAGVMKIGCLICVPTCWPVTTKCGGSAADPSTN